MRTAVRGKHKGEESGDVHDDDEDRTKEARRCCCLLRNNNTNNNNKPCSHHQPLISRRARRLSVSTTTAAAAALSLMMMAILLFQQQQQRGFLQRKNAPSEQPVVIDDKGPYLPPLQLISDLAWQQLLEKFHTNLYHPDTIVSANDIVLPVVIRNRQVLFRKEHADGLQGTERFDYFNAMMQDALSDTIETKARQQQHQKQQHRPHIPLHLPLPPNRSIPLILGWGDFRDCDGKIFPRFAWCTYRDVQTTCPTFAIPSYNIYRIRKETSEDFNSFHQHRKHHFPWSSKKRQAVWRGAATGLLPPSPNDGWTSLPRARLVNYSIHHPDLLDAGFVHSGQFSVWYPEEEPKLRNHSRFVDSIPFGDFQTYRAVVDTDGNSWSSRFGELLCLNSVVIKVHPKNKNYFFDELIPWHHYIPVQNDLSDLLDAIRFAVADENAKKVQAMIYHANEFCRVQLARDHLALDLFWIINGYIEILGTNATRWRQWNDMLQEATEQNVTFVASMK